MIDTTLNQGAKGTNTRDAVEALFLAYQDQLLNFLVRTLGYSHREDAEDLLQNVFEKAQKSLDAGTRVKREALTSWLYTIAKHTAYDFLRRERLIAWTPLSAFTEPVQESGFLYREEALYQNTHAVWYASSYGKQFEKQVLEQELLQTIFQSIPRHLAICLWLFEHEGLSCAEIAQQLGISPSAVKMRLMRARDKAEEKLSQLEEWSELLPL